MQHKILSYRNGFICLAVYIGLIIFYIEYFRLSIMKKSADAQDGDEILKSYKQLHDEILNGSRPEKIVYIKANTGLGYGNRLYGIISGILIAILSDAACAIDIGPLKGYIVPPLTRAFDHNMNETLEVYNYGTLDMQSWSRVKMFDYLLQVTFKEDFKYFYHREHLTALFFELCCNPKYFDKLLANQLVKNKTIQTAKQAIFNSTGMSDIQKLDSILQVGFEVGGLLLQNMWRVNAKINGLVDDYLQKYFHGHYVIGIQIRNEYVDLEYDVRRFRDCAMQIENYTRPTLPVRWFISTDSPLAFDALSKELPQKVFTSSGMAQHLYESDGDGIVKLLVDIELLSKCDEIIKTGGSTFSMISILKSQKMPYFIIGKERHEIGENCTKMSLGYPAVTVLGFADF